MRSGFVPVVGRPNVGKSTLVNALVGHKVVITSPRPQTTRNVVRGVVTVTEEPEFQAVLVDTPGLHKPRNALGERLNRLVYGTLAEADAVLFLLDATAAVGPGDRLIAQRLTKAGSPVIVVVNKTDAARRGQIPERLAEAAVWEFAAYVPVSALRGEGLDSILSELGKLLPEGPQYFPADAVTDQPESFLAGELIREKFLARLRDELPHSLVVDVRDIEQRPDGSVYVDARIIVERTSQKGIVIGKGGILLRDAGSEARTDLERLFGTRVYLDLRVRVEKNWQRKPQMLDRFGFH
ncbi:MAG: GTPase Era [Actinobacteria bacterium]|nr:GTPase Era [Actinomycetota bacterium]